MMDLGALGETQFARWCAEVGLVANLATRDRTGWDYLVEFPSSDQASKGPWDLRPPELTCRVQVKATEKQLKIPPISLSNWKRLVDSPLPAFVAAFQFDSKGRLVRAALLHVNDRVMSAVLKRLRALGADEKPHRAKLTIPVDEAEAIEPADGHGLVKLIRAAVGTSAEEYHRRKLGWQADVGYEEGHLRVAGTISLARSGMYDALVDFALGITRTLPFSLTEVSDIRFGMPRPVGQKPFEGGSLALPNGPPASRAEAQFSTPDGRAMALLTMQVYSPTSLFPFIPQDHWRLRLHHPHVEILYDCRLNQAQIRTDFPLSRTSALSDLYAAVQVLRVCEASQEQSSEPLRIDVNLENGRRLQLESPISTDRPSQAMSELARAITAAFELARAFGLPLSTPLAPEVLHDQHGRLWMMAGVLDLRPFSITDFAISSSIDESCVLGAPNVMQCLIGDRVLSVVFSISGLCEVTSKTSDGLNRLVIKTPAVRVYRRECRPLAGEQLDVGAALAEATRKIEEAGVICVIDEVAAEVAGLSPS